MTASPPIEVGATLLDGRYTVLTHVGAGGMGVVMRAYDRSLGCDVALKTVRQPTTTLLQRLKNEFRVREGIHHPGLVRLGELHEDDGRWFFSMELVDGLDLFEWVDGDVARLNAAVRQVADALIVLHAHNCVHRDV